MPTKALPPLLFSAGQGDKINGRAWRGHPPDIVEARDLTLLNHFNLLPNKSRMMRNKNKSQKHLPSHASPLPSAKFPPSFPNPHVIADASCSDGFDLGQQSHPGASGIGSVRQGEASGSSSLLHSWSPLLPPNLAKPSTSDLNLSLKFTPIWNLLKVFETYQKGVRFCFFPTSLHFTKHLLAQNPFTATPTTVKQICPHRNTTTIPCTLPAVKKAQLGRVFTTAGFSDCY